MERKQIHIYESWVQSSTKEFKINFIAKQDTDVIIDLGEDFEVSSACISQR